MKLYYRIKCKLRTIFFKPVDIPSYETKRATIREYKERFNLVTLVETGTFMGDTVEYFKGSFDKVISIELAEELAINAKKRFEKDANVVILQGDSGVVLKDIVNSTFEPVLFWLDGHYSSEFYVGDTFIKTGRTDVDTPVVAELTTILSCSVNHVVLIDDARLFTGIGDYPPLSRLRKMIRQSGKNYSIIVENDIIRITPPYNDN